MKKFKEILKESIKDNQVYFVDKELWVAYDQGSGQTEYMQTLKYLTNKQSDKNFSVLVDKIVKWAESRKPIKSAGNSSLFQIAVYTQSNVDKPFRKYDCFGGDISPISSIYMIVDVNETINVINFFKSRNEAMSWLKSMK